MILALASGDDPCVELVRRAVLARGGELFALDTGQFPTAALLRLEPERWAEARLGVGASSLSIGEVSAIWIRHFTPGAGLPTDLEPALDRACRSQSSAALWALVESLPVFTLDPPEVLLQAPLKPRQMQLARAAGLDVPRTLLTNDPAAVRAFAALCPTGIVTKLVSSSLSVDGSDGREPIYTRRVEPGELASLEGLDLCPMLFQERVEKALELRITVVGSQMFTAAVDPTTSALGADDWRRDRALLKSFRPYRDLPEAVGARLFALLDRLGLDFATVDLILTPDGRYVFLEVNTISFFSFVELATSLPISGAVADLLLGRSAPRVERPADLRRLAAE